METPNIFPMICPQFNYILEIPLDPTGKVMSLTKEYKCSDFEIINNMEEFISFTENNHSIHTTQCYKILINEDKFNIEKEIYIENIIDCDLDYSWGQLYISKMKTGVSLSEAFLNIFLDYKPNKKYILELSKVLKIEECSKLMEYKTLLTEDEYKECLENILTIDFKRRL